MTARRTHGHILIVGAGLAGAVYARCVAECGLRVVVIDRRPHLAGNAFDEVDRQGVRVHRYGPHFFHSANRLVLEWIRHFAEWVGYEHKVRAVLPNAKLAPLPINIDTLNTVFGLHLRDQSEAADFLSRIAQPISKPRNAAEYLASKIGTELCDIFFRPYTRKMWGMELEAISPGIIKRIPLVTTKYDSYFPESEVQLLPKDGYTNFVQSVLDHKNISVILDTPFDHFMLREATYCFSSIAIDEHYSYREGPLPYRSLHFHHRREATQDLQGPWSASQDDASFSVVNFTDDSAYTRETAWHRLPYHVLRDTGYVTITREEPCDYKDNGLERYYPIDDCEGRNRLRYEAYRTLAVHDRGCITFIGRCGTYRYLDMDQVIAQSLMGATRWLRAFYGISYGPLAGTPELGSRSKP